MPRPAVALALLALALLAACGDGDGATPRTPGGDSTAVPIATVERPAGVPGAAVGVAQTEELGTIVRRANADPLTEHTRRLDDASCANDVIALQTNSETIYAQFPPADGPPCDRFWDAATSDLFVGEELAIVLEVTPARQRVLLETVAGASSEFTVAGIWVE